MEAKVRVLAGPARSGKTTYLLEKYRKALKSSEKSLQMARCLWIGPTSQAVLQVQERLLSSPVDAFLSPQVLTFASFADSIVAASPRRIRPISKLQKRRILYQVVQTALDSSRLKHFSRVAQTPGFLAQVDEFIAELKRQDIWPEDFDQRCRQPREHDLAAIYHLYQQFLNDNDLYDPEGRFWAARTELRETELRETELRKGSTNASSEISLLVVDGFSDFTSSQYDILKLLAGKSSEMLVSLTLDLGSLETGGRSLLFSKPKNTLARLKKKLPALETLPASQAHFALPALAHLEQHLFSSPNQSIASALSPDGIEILAAQGVHGEIEELARRIKSLLHSGQARPEEIVVVFRSLRGVAGRIHEVFIDHGIPLALGPWQDLASSPLHRAIRTLLQLHNEDWPFRQLLAVVGNRLFRRFDISSEEQNHNAPDARIAIEICIRAAQHPLGRSLVLEQLKHWAAFAPEATGQEKTSRIERREKLASRAKLSHSKLQELATLFDQLPQQATVAQWIGHLEGLLSGLDLFAKSGEKSTSPLQDLATAWNILQTALTSLANVDSCSSKNAAQLSVGQLLDLLDRVGTELQLPVAHDAVGRVQILGAEAARHVSAPYVFLAGLKEQAFSSSDPTDPLFHAHDLEWMEQPTEQQPPETQHAGDEMLLFYELVTRATRHLTLSYAALDAKGQTLSPSPLLTELQHCFGNQKILRKEMSLGESTIKPDSLAPMSIASFRRQSVSHALTGDRTWLAGITAQPKSSQLGFALLDNIDCVARRGERGQFGSFDGLLLNKTSQGVLAKRFDTKHLWSPSQLEGYATCPFRFFSEQILMLQPPSELTLSSDARRRGSLLHQVLASLHAHLEIGGAESLGSDASQLIERFHKILSDTVIATPLEGLQHWLREIERREIGAWAEQYAQQEVDYQAKWSHLDQPLRPTHFEVRFGPEVHSGDSSDDNASVAIPFELDLGHEQILLTGQIDRVDVGRVGKTTVFNIIDYKSGAEVKLEDKKIRSGRQLQLPLYALAAERLLLAEQGAVALSTGYWSIQGQGFNSKKSNALEIHDLKDQAISTSDQWNELQPVLLERIGQLVGGIRKGQFPVLNEDQHCTRYCSLSTICRVAHVRSLEKQLEPEAPPTNE